MVVYQALYGDFKTYVRPLSMFLSEVDKDKYPNAGQTNRFELQSGEAGPQKDKPITSINTIDKKETKTTNEPDSIESMANQRVLSPEAASESTTEGSVNTLLLKFLEAASYSKKLEVISSNLKHLDDRLINDMAVSLDCAVEEGPIEKRVQELIFCLKAMCRFEDRRLR